MIKVFVHFGYRGNGPFNNIKKDNCLTCFKQMVMINRFSLSIFYNQIYNGIISLSTFSSFITNKVFKF